MGTADNRDVKVGKRKVDTVHKPALLVIDMQNDFIDDDGWFIKSRVYHPHTVQQKSKLYQACRTLIKASHDCGVPVIYARTVLRADGLDSAFSVKMDRQRPMGGYLVDGTWGAQIVDGLTPESSDVVLQKSGYSAFQFTPLHRILRNLGVDSLILTGGPIYESVNATGRDGSAHGYVSFAVPDALYPVNYPNPQFLRMRMHLSSMAEAIKRLQQAVENDVGYKYQPAAEWRSLLHKSCLLLVDLQNGFVRQNGYNTGPHELWPQFVYRQEDYQRLLTNNVKLIQWAHELGLPVINARGVIRPDTIDSAQYPDSQREFTSIPRRGCFVGDWNAEFAEEIAPTGNDIELIKHGHSAFAFTILDRLLSNLGVKQCFVTGGNVAGCLEETLRDGNALGYSMVAVRDATYRPSDPRLELMANECANVLTDEVVTATGAQPNAEPERESKGTD
jgi:ureidoacrylate peracid hydrolase